MLFLTLTRPFVPEIRADGYELRLDLFPKIDAEEIRKIPGPLLFTFKNSVDMQLLELMPDYVDLDYKEKELIEHVAKTYPETKIIVSYHNFQETPDLEKILKEMHSPYAYTYKIACMAKSTNDALRMLLFLKANPGITAISMGPCGTITRILGPVFGNFIDYAPVEEATAPGQLSYHELKDIYRYFSLNPNTKLYGLIGNPLDKSPGHIVHNANMQDAVYVKMPVNKEELSEFIPLAKSCGFKGLSVTIPLKEAIIPFLDEIEEEEIGAVNTITFDKTTKGYNTDGKGAADALGDIRNKKLLILGAGGSARAIAYEAKKRGADVYIHNRTRERAEKLSQEFNCKLGTPQDHYDFIINATPESSNFLDIAVDSSFGRRMWDNQAKRQYAIFKDR